MSALDAIRQAGHHLLEYQRHLEQAFELQALEQASTVPQTFPSRLVKVPEMASRLGKHPEVIRNLCRTGKISGAKKQGTEWCVSEAALERYINDEPALVHISTAKPKNRKSAISRQKVA